MSSRFIFFQATASRIPAWSSDSLLCEYI